MFARILSELRYRWRALVSRDRMEDELGDELAFHLEQEQRKLEARGVPAEEARRLARLAFGGVDGVREATRDARGVRLFEDTWDDLRIVLRSLRWNRAFTIGVAGALALGIGVNAAMFGVVDRLMFRTPQGLLEAGRVHRVHLRWIQNRQPRTERNMQFPRYQDFARTLQTVDRIGAFQVRNVAIGEGEDTREGRVAIVSASYLEFFDAPPVLGRWFTAEEDRPPVGSPVAVVSHAYWLTQFGGRAEVIGQSLQIDRLRASIIGVAPPGFTGVSDAGAPAVFVAMSAFAHALRGPGYDTSYNWGWLELLVRRAPGVSVEAVDADLSRAFLASWRNEDQARGATTDFAVWQPTATLGPVHLGRGPDAEVEARVALWTSGVAILVLLIACANVANLFLSRAVSRRREVAMRLALGVGRGRLTRQFVLESASLGLLGAVGGLLLASWFGGAPQRLLLPAGDEAPVIGDARTLLYAAALALVAGVLTAIVPSVMAGRIDVATALKSGGRGSSTRRSRLQAGLVVVQAALSVVLLIGAALFVRSLQHAQQHRLGFDVDPLVVAEVNSRGARLTDAQWQQLGIRIMEAVRRVPALSHVTMTASVPFWSNEARGLSVPGVEKIADLGRFTLQAGTAEYFETTGTRILRGRGFDRTDGAGAQPVIVVSEPMAEALWPGQEPLGRCVRVGPKDSPCRTVIGVAEESAMTALEPTRTYTYYLPVDQFPDGASAQFFMRVRGEATAAIPDLRREIQALLPAPAYVNIVPLRRLIDPQFRAWQLGATAFAAFGGLALVLAVLGLHSVMAYESARRAQEFGVRLALGATPGRILRLVLGRGAALAAVGISIGSLIALAASGPFSALMFRQSARDPVIFSAVALVLLLAGCLACAWPALRATRLDPSDTLRAE
jgi:predicted permease